MYCVITYGSGAGFGAGRGDEVVRVVREKRRARTVVSVDFIMVDMGVFWPIKRE